MRLYGDTVSHKCSIKLCRSDQPWEHDQSTLSETHCQPMYNVGSARSTLLLLLPGIACYVIALGVYLTLLPSLVKTLIHQAAGFVQVQAELKMCGITNIGMHNLSPGMVTTDLLMSGQCSSHVGLLCKYCSAPKWKSASNLLSTDIACFAMVLVA